MYLLNIIVRQRPAIFELFAGEDQPLLVRWDAFLVLDLALDIVDCVRGLDLEGDGLAREGLNEAVEGGLETMAMGVARAEGESGFLKMLTSALLIESLVSDTFEGGLRDEIAGLTLRCGLSRCLVIPVQVCWLRR
jgi:hypothetical protein